MIIDHTDVVEAMIGRGLIPESSICNLHTTPDPERTVWYEFDDSGAAVNVYDHKSQPWAVIAARSHDEVSRIFRRIDRTAIRIGDEIPQIDREVVQWVAVQTDPQTIAVLSGHKEVYVTYEGALWWGRTSADLMTDPVYIWLVDRQLSRGRP